jgi:hypothetical protein
MINNIGKFWLYRALRGESNWISRHFIRVHSMLHTHQATLAGKPASRAK